MEDVSHAVHSVEAHSQLNVLGEDGDALGVNGAQIGVREHSDRKGLSSLLQGQQGEALEAQVRLAVFGNLPHKALKRPPTIEVPITRSNHSKEGIHTSYLGVRSWVFFWYLRISRRATVPGRYLHLWLLASTAVVAVK